MSGLPRCGFQYPSCGACGAETDHDGDSFYCDPCGLDYGYGVDGAEAVFLVEDTPPCGKPCSDTWHRASSSLGARYECRACALPAGHRSPCWTNCTPPGHARRDATVSDCRAEECPMWDGCGCPCDVFGFDPNDPPRDGVFTVTTEFEERP